MEYLFLTGATGLLGSYLLRDLLNAGTKLAVLVRSTRFASARQRVDAIMARWEKQAGHALPRPVVLEGDLSSPNLGLDDDTLRWVSLNCKAFMHNAASLTFQSESGDNRLPNDEPWRSNLYGTQNVLEFCKTAGIREFHHVSTAYVCGLREDRVFENELDVGQTFGNDYEISKSESETMVRNADFLDSLTVYRPGIIFGDAQTGYTSTYHGFYVPLKLVATLIAKTAGIGVSRDLLIEGIAAAGKRLREVLNFTGSEVKHYVPVDWVSAVMAGVYSNTAQHGQTYHLTPSEGVRVEVTQDVMEKAILKYAELTPPEKISETPIDWEEFEAFFIDGMSVYRSYWRNDPQFDDSNTRRAMPNLPCPVLDEALLNRMCKFAVESNFGWPVEPMVKPNIDLQTHLDRLPSRTNNNHRGAEPVFLGLQVNGHGGGQWELTVRGGEVVGAAQGLSGRCTATYYLNSKTFECLTTRDSTVDDALLAGRVLIEGNGVPLPELTRLLETVATSQ